MPGLGHALMGKLGRALIWLAGVIAIALVIGSDDSDRPLAVAIVVALSVLSALDIALLIRLESGERGSRER